MLFSVIIPVYNARLTLDQCIRSVLSQETQDLEVCIVDDGSTDGSDSICDTWARTDSRIKVHHQSNKGVSSARNKGLEMATGDWITFLDSDDTIEGAYFPINPNDDIYDLYIQNGNVSHLPAEKIPPQDYHGFLRRMAHTTPMRGIYAKFIRRSIVTRYNIRFDSDQRVGEDTLFFMDYLSHANAVEIIDSGLYVVNTIPEDDWIRKYHFTREEAYSFFDTFILHYKNLPILLPKLAQAIYDIFELMANKDEDIPLSWKLHPAVLGVKRLQFPVRSREFRIRCNLAKFLSFFYIPLKHNKNA